MACCTWDAQSGQAKCAHGTQIIWANKKPANFSGLNGKDGVGLLGFGPGPDPELEKFCGFSAFSFLGLIPKEPHGILFGRISHQ